MLTRSEVAHRLRRSVATVRRIEGELLFPEVDERGVYRFEETDVDALVDAVNLGHVRLWREVNLSANDWRCWLTRTTSPHRPPTTPSKAAAKPANAACSRCAEILRSASNCAKENQALRELARRLGEIAAGVCPTGRAGTTLARELLRFVEELSDARVDSNLNSAADETIVLTEQDQRRVAGWDDVYSR